MKLSHLFLPSLLTCAFGAAHATTVSVSGADVIYAPGNAAYASSLGGTIPVAITLNGATSITFSATGTVSLNGGGNYNDADGVGAAVSSSYNSGTSQYGGISAPNAGFLTGLFTGSSTTNPGGSSYTATSETATSFSPLQNQAFFIGDGLTGDGTGTLQTFYVPTGATMLYLGISDAGGYNGAPGSYSDNSGAFTVNYSTAGGGTTPPSSVTPEPSSLVLLGTGVLSVAGAARRRLRRA